MKYNIYKDIIAGKINVEKLYESENVLAFYHTKPSYEKHIVIIPQKHILDVSEISDGDMEIIQEIMSVVRDLSQQMDKAKGIRLISNMGKFQDSPHLHFNLVQGGKI